MTPDDAPLPIDISTFENARALAEAASARAIDTPPAEIVAGGIYPAELPDDVQAIAIEFVVVPLDNDPSDLRTYRLRLLVAPEFAEQLGITPTPIPDTEETNQ